MDNTALQVDLQSGTYDKVPVNDTGSAPQQGSYKRSLVTSKRAVVRGTNNYGDACTPTTTRPTGQCDTMTDCQNSNGRYAYWGSNICGGGDNVICCIRDTAYIPTGSPTSPAPAPTPSPTSAPTSAPTQAPTSAPTQAPTSAPTPSPTRSPTAAPTKAPTSAPTKAPTSSPAGAKLTLPSGSYNWRGTQAVTPVKDQGQCGSCWTFASSGAAESSWAIKTGGTQLDLAEQRLVDCVTGSNGCNGGNAETAFPYIVSNGDTLEATLPYTHNDGTCPTNVPFDAPAKWTDWKTMSDRSIAGIQQALVTYGPMVVYVDADDSWQSYSGGVLSGTGSSINHAVLLVGYDATKNAWVIKNSWGTWWGDQGFVYVDVNNNYAMTQWGPYAILC